MGIVFYRITRTDYLVIGAVCRRMTWKRLRAMRSRSARIWRPAICEFIKNLQRLVSLQISIIHQEEWCGKWNWQWRGGILFRASAKHTGDGQFALPVSGVPRWFDGGRERARRRMVPCLRGASLSSTQHNPTHVISIGISNQKFWFFFITSIWKKTLTFTRFNPEENSDLCSLQSGGKLWPLLASIRKKTLTFTRFNPEENSDLYSLQFNSIQFNLI